MMTPSDRLPPHDPTSEQAILGSILLDPTGALPVAQAALTAESFYSLPHRALFEAMLTAAAAGKPVDSVAMGNHLTSTGQLQAVGGYAYLSALMDVPPSGAAIDYYCQIVTEKALLRQVIKVCQDAVSDAYEAQGDVLKLLDGVEQRILAIRPVERRESDMKTLLEEATVLFDRRAQAGDDRITGLTTGLSDLDRLTDGLHPGEMIVVAAYPSVGKTAFSCGMAFANALAGESVAILSAEMRPVELIVRALCSEARVNFYAMTARDCMKLPTHTARLVKAPIRIEAIPGASIQQVCAILRRLHQKHAIKLAVVDYIQLIEGPGDNREQIVNGVAKGLLQIAKELSITLIAPSQLNDDGKVRESRGIGQHADGVWMLENDGEWCDKVQPCILRVEKCRHGQTGKRKLTFLKTITRFENAARIPNGAESTCKLFQMKPATEAKGEL